MIRTPAGRLLVLVILAVAPPALPPLLGAKAMPRPPILLEFISPRHTTVRP